MSVQKGSIDEIDQIMNEIEELQKSMGPGASAPAAAAPKLAVVAAPVEAETAFGAEAETTTEDSMAEFQSGRGETSMEETLANLKDDEPSGPNLIDQAIEADAAQAAEVAEVAEAPQAVAAVSELNEDEEIDKAIAEAEAAALIEEVVVEEIEEPVMSKAKNNEATVSLKLSGEMKLNLSYEFEGQEVTLGFVDGALQVVMSDGTEFKLPVRRANLRKVV